MAKLVTKWRYLKPDAARQAQAYIRYIATREGVEKYVEENGARPAAQAQRVLVEKLLRDFPDARRSFEYEDYARRPTVRNASEFITRTLEEHLELFDARSNYVSYIAQRPRVQRSGAHGLFTQEEDAPDLNAAARAVSEHDGNIWTCILSLRREDAARLSYDKADAWRALLRANAAEIAARFNVPVGSFHWCGAFHNEAHHPHVHLVCYADRVQKPALTKEGVVQLRSLLARQIFRDELDAIYIRQSQSRDELRDLFSARLKEAVAGMRDAPAEMPVLESLLERLSEEVRDRKGKLRYGYLPWPVKSIVDSIISELEKQPQVKAAYSAWWELRKTVLSTYRDSLPEQAPPLHTQKEFRHLKNIVLRIAKEGCPAPEPEQEFDAVQDPQDRGAQHAVYGAKRLLDAAREEEYPDEDVQAALRTLLGAAERAGAQIVCFENCAGIKPARCHVNAEADDILDAIADAYLTVGCAVMTPNRRRFEMIPALIEEFHADAVLDIALSSCHTYLIEGRSLREFCRGMGVPYMALETDYSQLDAGQIDTRIAAFVESL